MSDYTQKVEFSKNGVLCGILLKITVYKQTFLQNWTFPTQKSPVAAEWFLYNIFTICSCFYIHEVG